MMEATTTILTSVCSRMDYLPGDDVVDEFIRLAYFSPNIAVDTETTGYEIRDGRGHAMGVSIAYNLAPNVVRSAYFPFRHKNGQNYDKIILDKVRRLIEDHPSVVMHNSKFDLVSLATLGINRTGKFYDTMLMAHMVDENVVSKALDYLGKYYLKDPGKEKMEALELFIKANGWSNVPAILMYSYACKDAELTLVLFHLLSSMMDAQDLFENNLWDIEQDFVRLLIKMEKRGVLIDTVLCEEQYDVGVDRMKELQSILKANPASPKDLEKLIIDDLGLPVVKRTPKGKPSFDKEAMRDYEEALELLGNDNLVAKQILEYRGWQKTTSSNYAAYLELLSPDGRLRPNYKIHGTRTGRLSCEKPNLQQIPRASDNPWNGRLKQAFVAKDGYTLFEADYSQLELRLAAAYANEKSLLDAFSDRERDVFSEMAENLGMQRTPTKTLTYTIQYGGGVNRLMHVFGLDESKARAIRENFYETYPGFRRMTNIASVKAKRQGYLKLWTGRRRHFSDPQAEAHKAFNSVIQGGAAEIMKRTMLRMNNIVDTEDCRMLLQVHDSIVFEVKDSEREKILPEIQIVMESVEPDFGVRFACDVHPWSKAS